MVACQGGGAYGAYSAGVLIQMLLDPKIKFMGGAGTSAGAFNLLIVADRMNSARSYEEGVAAAVQGLLEGWHRVVLESAPMMHALDVAETPWKPEVWQKFFASAMAAQTKAVDAPNVFDFWRSAFHFNPAARHVIDAMEAPWKGLQSQMIFGNDVIAKPSANLPALDAMARNQQRLSGIFDNAAQASHFFGGIPRGFDIAMGVLESASNAIATQAFRKVLRQMLTLEPLPDGDFLCVHAANGKYVKVFINTAEEQDDGSLVNRVHSGLDLTLKRAHGSAALKGLLEPSLIDGKKHWDGGYTENTSLSTLLDHAGGCDGVVVIGTNRPTTQRITPRLQVDIPRADLAVTKDLIWYQMYDEVVLHAENRRSGPSLHMVAHMHAPSNDWTAKQNTSDWHIRSLLARGQADGLSMLIDTRPYIGRGHTVSREWLEDVARTGKIAGHINNHARFMRGRADPHAPQAA